MQDVTNNWAYPLGKQKQDLPILTQKTCSLDPRNLIISYSTSVGNLNFLKYILKKLHLPTMQEMNVQNQLAIAQLENILTMGYQTPFSLHADKETKSSSTTATIMLPSKNIEIDS